VLLELELEPVLDSTWHLLRAACRPKGKYWLLLHVQC
jgi:hypothetical protein